MRRWQRSTWGERHKKKESVNNSHPKKGMIKNRQMVRDIQKVNKKKIQKSREINAAGPRKARTRGLSPGSRRRLGKLRRKKSGGQKEPK